jgi:hypothetical protein
LNHKQILLRFGIPDLLSFLQAWKSNWNETFLLILRCREPGLLVHASAALFLVPTVKNCSPAGTTLARVGFRAVASACWNAFNGQFSLKGIPDFFRGLFSVTNFFVFTPKTFDNIFGIVMKEYEKTLGLLNHKRDKYIKSNGAIIVFFNCPERKDGNWIICRPGSEKINPISIYLFSLSLMEGQSESHCGALCNVQKTPMPVRLLNSIFFLILYLFSSPHHPR